MDHVPFYKTRGGEKFLFKTVPDLIRAIERMNDILENLSSRLDREACNNDQPGEG